MERIVFVSYKISCVLMLLASMSAYFFWGIPIAYFYILSILLFIMYQAVAKSKNDIHFQGRFLIPVLALFLLDLPKADIIPIKTTLLCVVLYQMLSLSDEKRKEVLEFSGKSYALILLISLTFFLLSWFISLPSFGYIYFDDGRADYAYENYFFFLKLTSIIRGFRFTSIFLEPGHVGMICAFFVYAFKFSFKKWYVVVFVVALLFTISLAGYLLLIAGFVFYSLCQKGWAFVKYLLIGAIICIPAYFVALNYNGGDNLVNSFIIERLQYDDEQGLVGNNRTDDATTDRFYSFIGTSDFWLGYSSDQYARLRDSDIIHGAGYKIFFFQHGIIGIILLLVFYIGLAKRSKNRKYMYLMVLLYAVCFVQRAYPLWVAWLLPFVCVLQFDRNYLFKDNSTLPASVN